MRLFRDWEVKKTIGKGSFGTVYEVENTDPLRNGERAAIKKIVIPKDESEIEVLRSDAYDDASITRTFHERLRDIVNEYRLMQQVSGNTNIVNCRDIGYIQHDDGIGWDIYIVMELLTPLRKLPTERFTEEEVVRLGRDICRALSVCAKRGIIHRDVKPDNIFVSEYGDYKLGDFGISRVMEGTRASTIGIGTYDYMAPEVLRESYDRTADLYSLGMVLYWLLNERRTPFLKLPPAVPTASEKELARKRRFNGDPLPPPAHGSEELKRIVLKACAFDPKERYQSAEEMLRDLLKLGGESSLSSPAEQSETATSPDLEEDETIGLFADEKGAPSEVLQEATEHAFEQMHYEAEEEQTVSAFVRSKPLQLVPQPTRRSKAGLIFGTVAILVFLIIGCLTIRNFQTQRYGYDIDKVISRGSTSTNDYRGESETRPPHTFEDLPCAPVFLPRSEYTWYTVVEYRIDDIDADLTCTISANIDFTEFYLDTEFYGDKQETRTLYDGENFTTIYDLTGFMTGDTLPVLNLAFAQNIWVPLYTSSDLPCVPVFSPRSEYAWYTVVEYRINDIDADLTCTISANIDFTEFYLDTEFYGDKQETRTLYDGENFTTIYDLTGFMTGDTLPVLNLAFAQDIWVALYIA